MRVEDILDAVARIQRYTRGISFEAFCANDMAVDAVVRNFAVIGEAARHVPPDVEARHPDVPWRDMRDMRNVVVHGYFRVSLPIVWDTIRNDLPPLVPRLRDLLDHEEAAGR